MKECLSEAEKLTRHLLVDIREWHSLENFKAARMVRNRFGADSVRLVFDLLAENGIVDVHNHQNRVAAASAAMPSAGSVISSCSSICEWHFALQRFALHCGESL